MTYHNPFNAFDSIFADSFESLAPLLEARRPRSESSLEWFEDDSNFYARIDVPGVKKEQLNLEFDTAASLSILAKGSDESELLKKLNIPEDIEIEAASAKLERGILLLTLPKAEKRKPIVIEVA